MFKLLSFLFGRRRAPPQTGDLYRAIVAQSRKSDFYSRLGVPDSLDGRFDMIILHAFLVMRRLGRVGADGAALSQALFDLMFADMDNSLREIGVGDLSVGKKVKIMAQAFYGRVEAYEAGLGADDGAALKTALARNLYGTVTPPAEGLDVMAAYVKRADAILALQSDDEIMAGNPAFSSPLW
jgi:cytochrome b pre-mRNA-processing protein 3